MISHSGNLRVIGHSDQGGRPDGVQVMLHDGHAYVGHMFSDGITVLDVQDPRAPRAVGFVACPPNTRSHHIQVHGGLLLATNSANIWAMQRYADQADYFTAPLADSFTRREREFTAGLRVFDLTDPAAPREIGFCPVDGIGLHRIWWVGGRYAYASCHFDGFTDHVLAVFDVGDPTRPHLVNRWALPGMDRAAGKLPAWPPGKRWALHHMIVAGDRGYAAWRDGGVPGHGQGAPAAPRRVMDVRDPANPVPFATLPQPAEADYCARGGKFGPHNLHENRPGTLQSETLVFATWHNAGVRVFDLSNPFQPREAAHCVPAAPGRLADIRPGCTRQGLGRRSFLRGAAAAGLAATPARAQAAPTRIDVHHHYTSPSLLAMMQGRRTNQTFNMQWTVQKSLDAMDAAGVAKAVVSTSDPGVLFGGYDPPPARGRAPTPPPPPRGPPAPRRA